MYTKEREVRESENTMSSIPAKIYYLNLVITLDKHKSNYGTFHKTSVL